MCNIALQIFRKHFSCTLEISLIVFEDDRLIRLQQIISEDIGIHKSLSALTEDVDCFLEELYFDPRHIMLLHFFHLLFDRCIQLVLELKTLHVIHVTVAIE